MRKLAILVVILAFSWSCTPGDSLGVASETVSAEPISVAGESSVSSSRTSALRAPELDDMGDVGLVPVLFPSLLTGGSDADCDFSDPFGSCH